MLFQSMKCSSTLKIKLDTLLWTSFLRVYKFWALASQSSFPRAGEFQQNHCLLEGGERAPTNPGAVLCTTQWNQNFLKAESPTWLIRGISPLQIFLGFLFFLKIIQLTWLPCQSSHRGADVTEIRVNDTCIHASAFRTEVSVPSLKTALWIHLSRDAFIDTSGWWTLVSTRNHNGSLASVPLGIAQMLDSVQPPGSPHTAMTSYLHEAPRVALASCLSLLAFPVTDSAFMCPVSTIHSSCH